MAQVPANPKLWALLTSQARAKFRVYPSPAAAHWVHQEYVDKGGRFVEGTKKHPVKSGKGDIQDRKDDRRERGKK